VWQSSDETVVSVLNGVITALIIGTCDIKFTNDEATVKFGVSITKDSTNNDLLISVINGPSNQPNEYDIKSAIMTTYEKGTWSSSDDNTVTVVNGLVTAKKADTCTVTCSDSIKNTITFDINITSNSLNALPQHSQALVLRDTTNQIEDISYAAAFELGRLTALDDVSFTKEFYKWKSQTAMAMRLSTLSANSNYKHTFQLTPTVSQLINPMPAHVVQKFTAWKYLEGIPFRYMVPQSQMLPKESIRFFTLDYNWINAFICGAFSIGHTAKVDFSPYLKGLLLKQQRDTAFSGILINSMVVSGWPDFMVDAQSETGEEIQLLRKADLDENIRMYLVSGPFTQLEFYLHHGKTHSGFMINDNNNFTKMDGKITVIPKDDYMIDINDLVTQLAKLNVNSIAEFGGAMLESIPKVVFSLK
jgi:VCBS repeat-containing protein